ncbi:glycoside hydrolase superfamily, partial [Pavlovales sp. CCMP2436]
FPAGFLWGTASAAHQVEGGCTNNNWARWEETADAKSGLPRPRAANACEHWTRYREDIALMKQLGMTSYRFSIEWSKIEPSPGVYDAEALAHYHEVLDALHEAGIEPMLTLFHFTIPKWFEELGGFEVESNSGYFVAFAQRVFSEYSSKCKLWCTINEPEHPFSGPNYVQGLYSVKCKLWCTITEPEDVNLAAIVMRNLLEAHILVYHALKQSPGGQQAQVGIVKDVFQFEPYNALSPLDIAAAAIVDNVMNESILRFLRTGHFFFWMPGQVRLSRTNTRAPSSYDFIGLNYYSHYHVRVKLPTATAAHPFELVHLPREEALMTDLPYPLFPEGFYHALVRVGKLGKPVYVTESGIADARDDRRAQHLRRYLYAMSCAIADGVDVRGYYHWTLMDNFEWAEGWNAKFGLYACDPKTQERVMRPSAKVYQDVVNRFASGEIVLAAPPKPLPPLSMQPQATPGLPTGQGVAGVSELELALSSVVSVEAAPANAAAAPAIAAVAEAAPAAMPSFEADEGASELAVAEAPAPSLVEPGPELESQPLPDSDVEVGKIDDGK